MSERTEYGAEVPWSDLAREFANISTHRIHREERQLHGDAFYAEALRRLLTGHVGKRWLTTKAQAEWESDTARFFDRSALEDAKKQAAEAREEARRGFREHAHQLADWVRQAVNARTVPSRYRREGALAVADWIDPEVKASPYTSVDGAA
jgi:hypothetical protein